MIRVVHDEIHSSRNDSIESIIWDSNVDESKLDAIVQDDSEEDSGICN